MRASLSAFLLWLCRLCLKLFLLLSTKFGYMTVLIILFMGGTKFPHLFHWGGFGFFQKSFFLAYSFFLNVPFSGSWKTSVSYWKTTISVFVHTFSLSKLISSRLTSYWVFSSFLYFTSVAKFLISFGKPFKTIETKHFPGKPLFTSASLRCI